MRLKNVIAVVTGAMAVELGGSERREEQVESGRTKETPSDASTRS